MNYTLTQKELEDMVALDLAIGDELNNAINACSEAEFLSWSLRLVTQPDQDIQETLETLAMGILIRLKGIE